MIDHMLPMGKLDSHILAYFLTPGNMELYFHENIFYNTLGGNYFLYSDTIHPTDRIFPH